MYSLFVRSNIGSQFHKVEHRLESLISSRALCRSHGKCSALTVPTVFLVLDICFIAENKT